MAKDHSVHKKPSASFTHWVLVVHCSCCSCWGMCTCSQHTCIQMPVFQISTQSVVVGFRRLCRLQRRALHGEQYLELKGPLPRHGRLVSRPQLLDVRDKGPGKGIVTLVRTVTHDADTGHEVAVAEFTGRGNGRCGGDGVHSPPSPSHDKQPAVSSTRPWFVHQDVLALCSHNQQHCTNYPTAASYAICHVLAGISLSGGGSFRSPWPAPPRSPSAVAEAAPPQGRDPDATVSVPTGKDQVCPDSWLVLNSILVCTAYQMPRCLSS
jgi:hypothetical protein